MIGIKNPNKNGAPIISNFKYANVELWNIHIQNRYETQDARYQFLPVDPRQDTRSQTQFRQRYQGNAGLEQQPLAQTPAQQRQPNQAPAQQQSEQQPLAQAPAKSQQRTAPATSSQAVQQVIDLTNAERRKNGLPALTADAKLNSVAQAKSSDMQQKELFFSCKPNIRLSF